MKNKKSAKKLRNALQTFCDESSLHGVQFLAPSRNVALNIIWGCLFVLGLSAAALVCNELVNQWDESPVVTTIDSTTYSVQNIPFPAVTICPEMYNIWGFTERSAKNLTFRGHSVNFI